MCACRRATPHHGRTAVGPPPAHRHCATFVGLFLIIPLVFVFTQAFAKGIGFYLHTINDPYARSSIWLTLLAAGIRVPLNCASASVRRGDREIDFYGKNVLLTLIDLPFSVSPVVSGLIYVLVFGAQGWMGLWLNADHPACPGSPTG